MCYALIGVPKSTEESLSSRWEAGLESATSPLLAFLQGMGAQQLCVRVVAGMAMPPPYCVDVLGDSFSGLTDKVMGWLTGLFVELVIDRFTNRLISLLTVWLEERLSN